LDVDVLVREDNRRVSVVVAGRLLIVDLEVRCALILVDLKEEVRAGLNIGVHIAREAFLLLLVQLLLKAESGELLLDKLVNFALDRLEVVMIVVVDLTNTCEDALLLLR
jgi:hypothetical protein